MYIAAMKKSAAPPRKPPPGEAPPPRGRAIAVRPCFQQDLEWVRLIYHHHVLSGFGTFDTVPPEIEAVTDKWAAICARGWPYLVACDAADPSRIHGFAYAAQFRERPAYEGTFEDSLYVAPTMQGRGVGAALLSGLLGELSEIGARQVIAVIGDSANAASIKLHARAGFAHVGVLHAVGRKYGRTLDAVLMQRSLEPATSAPPR